MWSGSTTNIPTGWTLCDGNNENGQTVPDLRNRFIVGAGDQYNVKETGGSDSQSISGNTSSDESHNHGGSTEGHQLTVDEMPSHSHGYGDETSNSSGSYNGGQWYDDELTIKNKTTDSTGGDQAHDHGISSDGSHSHSFSGSIDTRSRYYSLAFIMKL